MVINFYWLLWFEARLHKSNIQRLQIIAVIQQSYLTVPQISQQRCQLFTAMASLNSLAGEQSVQCCEGISKPQRVCHNSAVQKCDRVLKQACSLFSPIFMKYSQLNVQGGHIHSLQIQHHFPNKQTNRLLFSIRRLSCPPSMLGFME